MNSLLRQMTSLRVSCRWTNSLLINNMQHGGEIHPSPAATAIALNGLPQGNSTGLFQNFEQIRGGRWRNVRPILGKPRPCPPGFVQADPHIYRYRPILPPDGLYTIKPLEIVKLEGKDPKTGRKVAKTIGGGAHNKYRWIDPVWRPNDDGTIREYRVVKIRQDPLRSAKLALLMGGGDAVWKTAAVKWREGCIVRVHAEIPRNPIKADDGDVHPVGALAVGTKMHQLELYPRAGSRVLINSGCEGEVVRHLPNNQVVVNIGYKRQPEIVVDGRCMCVVGQCSNVGGHLIYKWCPQRSRWLGKRPRSGKWHRKDGYCGRKIKKPREAIVFEPKFPPQIPLYQMEM